MPATQAQSNSLGRATQPFSTDTGTLLANMQLPWRRWVHDRHCVLEADRNRATSREAFIAWGGCPYANAPNAAFGRNQNLLSPRRRERQEDRTVMLLPFFFALQRRNILFF